MGTSRSLAWSVTLAALAAVTTALVVLGPWHRTSSAQEGATRPIDIAVAMPLAGPRALEGREIVDAVLLHAEEVNRAGGVGGRPLRVVAYDDEARAETAAAREREIVASAALAVVGHVSTSPSLAAAPVYREAGLPALTASASGDQLTEGNPGYFRLTFDIASQSRALALYARRVLGAATATVIVNPSRPGAPPVFGFEQAFPEAGGKLRRIWEFDAKAAPEVQEAALDVLAGELKGLAKGDLVYLGVSPPTLARDVIVGLRRRGATPILLGSNSYASDEFAALFAGEEEERRQPGYFTDGMLAAASALLDSASDRAQVFADDYRRAYGRAAGPLAAKYYDAAKLLVEAIRRSGVAEMAGGLEGTLEARRRLRDALAAFDQPQTALEGITGLLFFGANNTQPEPVRVGRFRGGRFTSAPVQLATVRNPALLDLERELALGNVLPFGGTYVWLQRVVYTGIDLIRVPRIDQVRGTFNAEFYLWFRYAGDNAGAGAADVPRVEFADAVTVDFESSQPLEDRTLDGVNYRLYRVSGEFKNRFDYHDYPFDRQRLALRLQNPRLTRERGVYVIDSDGLGLPRAEDADSPAFAGLAAWSLRGTGYFQDTFRTTSTRGDPAATRLGAVVELPGFGVVASLQRRSLVVLAKNLLPLGLLVLVVYATLHCPPSLGKERLSIPIGALLASAVLLTGITNQQLAEAAYTTAVEYVFYVFFGLCLLCIVAGLAAERLSIAKRPAAAHRLDMTARATYALVVAGTVSVYLWRYGDRLIEA